MSDDPLKLSLGAADPYGGFSRARETDIQAKLQGLAATLKQGSKVEGKEASPEALKAATDFEAMLVKEMVQSMWSSVPEDGMISGGREEQLYRDMLNDAVAKQISENQSMGIRDIVLKDITKLQKR